MDRQQALVELKELQERAKALEAIIKAPDTSTVFRGVFIKKPEPDSPIGQYYVTSGGRVDFLRSFSVNDITYGLAYVSKSDAEKRLKILKVEQKARIAVAAAWGSKVPDWNNSNSEYKWCFRLVGGKVVVDCWTCTYQRWAFPSEESINAFLKTVTTEEVKLLIMGMDADV